MADSTADALSRTFVLIPGAGGGATWYWHLVVPLLRETGNEAIAVDLPGPDPDAGLAEYADLVASAAAGRDNVVLVAQSLGGFTAPMAALRCPAAGIVLVNAMIPVPGETAGAWGENTGQAEAMIAAAKSGGYRTEFDVETYFLHDLAAEVLASGEERAEADAAFESACDFVDWPSIPVSVVAGADDRLFPASFQQRLARERLGIEADVLPGGHLIALSRPERLARYLLAAS
jgi:pimeloyl-ACP methyl ester carboxylesterase